MGSPLIASADKIGRLLYRVIWVYGFYFQHLENFDLSQVKETITVHIPLINILNESSIQYFAQCQDQILIQIQGVIHHDL